MDNASKNNASTFPVIDVKYYSSLDIDGFSAMMKDPAFCYKFYWLEAIVNLITESKTKTTFDEVIDEMIANAWYSVTEYHIHLSGLVLGEPRDGLERAIVKLEQLSGISSQASKTEVKNAIREYKLQLKAEKNQLTNMVPYRALAGFFKNPNDRPYWESAKRMTEYIRHFNEAFTKLPYTLGESSRLQKEVLFDPEWAKMIQDNATTILGWIQYEKVKWLQSNNPEVPSLIYKLIPGDKVRKLTRVQKLWNGVIELCPVHDVFNELLLEQGRFDVDHFIPWSFVMNDELWNLMPMDSNLNSSKSNNLPSWDLFFAPFARNQFLMYEKVHASEQMYKLYVDCFKDNLHSIWASVELYKPGHKRDEFTTILEKNMRPVYDSAKRQGYRMWAYPA